MKDKTVFSIPALKIAWILLLLAIAVIVMISAKSAGSVSIPSDSIFI